LRSSYQNRAEVFGETSAAGRGNLRNGEIMEAADTVDKSRAISSGGGLDSVRAKARMQRNVRLNKTEHITECQLQEKDSLQGIRTLKRKAAEEYTEECKPAMTRFEALWDWFQRSLGNR
jgi:hypothetical protein